MADSDVLRILNVAEKNSAAKSLAKIMAAHAGKSVLEVSRRCLPCVRPLLELALLMTSQH